MNPLTLSDAARLLNAERRGEDIIFTAVSTDSRRIAAGALFIALHGPNFNGHDFVAAAAAQGASAALVERFVPVALPQLRVADTRLALGRLGAAWRARFHYPLIALTGSNGKTTVKEMLRAILARRGPVLATEGNLNNDIGVPLMLLRLGPEHRYAIIEMGANHPGEIAYLSKLTQPDVALLNNAGAAHLEGFGDLDGVARAKGEIFQGLSAGGVAVINADDRYADYWRGLSTGYRVRSFGLEQPANISGQILSASAAAQHCQLQSDGQAIDIHLPMPGQHNFANALAAAAASLAVGATLEDIRQGLETMQGVGGRLQPRPGPAGSTVIDDTYNANPTSLAAALAALGGVEPRWLVLGDMGELGPGTEQLHAQAGQQARAAGFSRLYAVGEHSRRAVAAFGPAAAHFDNAEALIQALRQACADARPTILVKGSRRMRMERIVQALIDPATTSEARLPC